VRGKNHQDFHDVLLFLVVAEVGGMSIMAGRRIAVTLVG
jgi:hypothetical protein